MQSQSSGIMQKKKHRNFSTLRPRLDKQLSKSNKTAVKDQIKIQKSVLKLITARETYHWIDDVSDRPRVYKKILILITELYFFYLCQQTSL